MEETRIDYKRLLFFAFLGSLTILLLLRLAGASEVFGKASTTGDL